MTRITFSEEHQKAQARTTMGSIEDTIAKAARVCAIQRRKLSGRSFKAADIEALRSNLALIGASFHPGAEP